jgi:hypothetical protein
MCQRAVGRWWGCPLRSFHLPGSVVQLSAPGWPTRQRVKWLTVATVLRPPETVAVAVARVFVRLVAAAPTRLNSDWYCTGRPSDADPCNSRTQHVM